MTYEEKWTWMYGLISIVAFGWYLVWLLGQAFGIAPTQITYVVPMIAAIGSAVLASIVGNILIALAAPKEADKRDQRDQEIQRHGDYSGQFMVNLGGLAVLIMCMLQLNHFWIAHTMYFAFVGSAIVSSVVKIISYRQGFAPC